MNLAFSAPILVGDQADSKVVIGVWFGLVCFWTFFRFSFWRLLHGLKVLQLYTCQLTIEKKP